MPNLGYSPHRNRSDQPCDHYQELTDRVIADLETGTRPWQKPWDPSKSGQPSMPINATTGHRYRGINTLMLGMSALNFANNDPRWCTYKQAAAKGWQIRRGAKGTKVFFFKQLQVEDPNTSEDDAGHKKSIPLLRSFTVFHASQIDGIPGFIPAPAADAPWRRPEAINLILENSKADIRIGGDCAYYCPTSDHIQLPAEAAFQSPEGWGATALHEICHWAAAPHRLNRDLSGGPGSDAYAREELVAELASLFIGTELGLPTEIPNHASYISSWIKLLKSEKREIFRAAAAAQKCADYCLAFHPDFAAAMTETKPENTQQLEQRQAA